MALQSKHPGDVKKWLEKVIDSCETYQQCITCMKLIRNFRNMVGLGDISIYIYPLEDQLLVKKRTIRNEEEIKLH